MSMFSALFGTHVEAPVHKDQLFNSPGKFIYPTIPPVTSAPAKNNLIEVMDVFSWSRVCCLSSSSMGDHVLLVLAFWKRHVR